MSSSSPNDLSALSPLATELAATIARVASDVALVIDVNGVIASVAENPSSSATTRGAWVGQSWVDTATDGTRLKIQALLDEVGTAGVSRRREVNHPGQNGDDIPMTWAAIRLGERGPVLAVGRDMRTVAAIQQRFVDAQQDMERHYWGRRQAEARTEQLFHVASDGVLVLDAVTLQVLACDDTAPRLLGVETAALPGRLLQDFLLGGARSAVAELLANVRISGSVSAIRVRLPAAPAGLELSATPFQADGKPQLLVRVRGTEAGGAAGDPLARMAEHVESMADAVVVTDSSGAILMANPAFVRLARHRDEAQLKGRALTEVVADHDGAWARLVARTGALGMVPKVALDVGTTSADGRAWAAGARAPGAVPVQASAFLLTDGEQARLGFVLRPRGAAKAIAPSADLTSDLLDQLGRVPLDALLVEVAHRAERHFIEAALRKSNGFRSVAADVLGLSPEALELRLHRHQLATANFAAGGQDTPHSLN